MILDTSAVVAVLKRELPQAEIATKLVQADVIGIGAPTLFETDVVMVRALGEPGRGFISQFLEGFEVEVIQFGSSHRQIAAEALLRFGKGRHSARLNYGDCMSYATARMADEPLLYIGDDFAQTDIESA
ncbi:MAG: type II toxin-antitoxin system VapC family toxin [Actinobacteria bacterium]|nr:type II toxin-antitoxin system VapC family toxin [Actinomycetota bacterium]